MDYNTQRPKLIMPEYGRVVQDMVEYCKTIENAEERQNCANTIVTLMASMVEKNGDDADFYAKLWNHLAAIANYELEIEYPVEITREDAIGSTRERVPYPQKKIERRHYGAIVEKFTKALTEEEDEEKRYAMAKLIANHMKRDLSNWNIDVMSDEKVAFDMEQYTQGKVQLDLDTFQFVSDGELLSSLISTSVSSKKRKKRN